MCSRSTTGSFIAVIIKLLVATAITAATLTPPTNPSLSWGPCPDGPGKIGMECAPLTVPLDWTKPGARTATLMLGRLKSDDPNAGTVLVNFGGPGAPGIQFMREFITQFDPYPFQNLRRKMNIVTWDPRSFIGLSTPKLDISCLQNVPPADRRTPALPHNAAEFAQLQANSRVYADACRNQDPEAFDNMDTASNVRDMEAIRKALGQSRINLYMGSYGGVYGQTYAREYPSRIRTMVLDGTGDHSRDFDRSQDALATDNVVRWQRFANWCRQNASCVLHGQDVSKVWQGVVAKANRTPLPVTPTVSFDGSTAQSAAAGRVLRAGGPTDWAALAGIIAKAARGDGSGLAESADRPYPSASYPYSECREWPRSTSFDQLSRTVARLGRIDPNLGAGGTMVPALLHCAGWPASVDNPPRPLPAGVPPLLGVGTWLDFPATNRIVQRVPGSSSIYHDGMGHELYATGNTCVIAHVDTYFTTGKLPQPGTRC